MFMDRISHNNLRNELIAVNAASVLSGYLSHPGIGVFADGLWRFLLPNWRHRWCRHFFQREEKSAILFHHVMFGFDPRIWCHHT
jgi:hypothetical protein